MTFLDCHTLFNIKWRGYTSFMCTHKTSLITPPFIEVSVPIFVDHVRFFGGLSNTRVVRKVRGLSQ